MTAAYGRVWFLVRRRYASWSSIHWDLRAHLFSALFALRVDNFLLNCNDK